MPLVLIRFCVKLIFQVLVAVTEWFVVCILYMSNHECLLQRAECPGPVEHGEQEGKLWKSLSIPINWISIRPFPNAPGKSQKKRCSKNNKESSQIVLELSKKCSKVAKKTATFPSDFQVCLCFNKFACVVYKEIEENIYVFWTKNT